MTTDLAEDLEHHAQSLQLLMHVRFMGVVADVEHRLMVEAGLAWLAAASLAMEGKPIPKRWLKVIEAWRADMTARYPQFPEYPEFPSDDIVLLALATEPNKASPMTAVMIRALPDWGVPPVHGVVSVQPQPFPGVGEIP